MNASDYIALASFAVASLALWRTEVARIRDARTDILKRAEALRLDLDYLSTRIPQCLQSRRAVAAPTGKRASVNALEAEVQRDLPELEQLRAQVNAIPYVGAASVASDAIITVSRLEGRVKLLKDKYTAAWEEDEVDRQFLKDAALAKVNRMDR